MIAIKYYLIFIKIGTVAFRVISFHKKFKETLYKKKNEEEQASSMCDKSRNITWECVCVRNAWNQLKRHDISFTTASPRISIKCVTSRDKKNLSLQNYADIFVGLICCYIYIRSTKKKRPIIHTFCTTCCLVLFISR